MHKEKKINGDTRKEENAAEERTVQDPEAEGEEKRFTAKTPIMWSLIMFFIMCWILPLTIIVYLMLDMTTDKLNEQLERTIVTSADNAAKMCEMQLNEVMKSSRAISYISTIRDAYRQYQKDGNRPAFFHTVSRFLEHNYQYDDNVLNAALFFTDEPEETFYVARTGSTSNEVFNAKQRFEKKIQPLVMEIYPELDTDVRFLELDGHIYLIRNVMDPSYHPYAVLTLELDQKNVFQSMESTWAYNGGEVYVDQEIMMIDNENESGQREGLFQDRKMPEEIQNANNRKAKLLRKNGEYYVYVVRKPDRHSIRFVIKLGSQAIIDETENVKFVSILFVLFMVPLVGIIFLFFHRKITKPVSRLVKAFHVIENEKFGYRLTETDNSREFAYLTESFNRMSDKLKYQFETIYSEELALKDARIMALQSQINPHFLNNTLEIINWEARINENYKVSQMIENLSIMLEATMDRRHRRFVTLAEEMSYVEAYLFIIAQRLGERLHVEMNVDETLFNVKVPRLIIQPIIENAVEHGVNSQTHAKIVINVYGKEDKLVLEVRNSGRMSKADEEKIAMLLRDDYEPGEFGSASLGIRNVNRRIKIIYGEPCGLFVQNAENNETVSTIIVRRDYDNNKRQ